MRSIKKSQLQIFLIGFMMSMLLSGCGFGGGGAGSDTAAGNQSVEASKPYQLVFVYPGTYQKDELVVQSAINNYLKQKINATIELRPIDWGQWPDKDNLMIASREPVDIYFTAVWSDYSTNVAKGAFMDLGPLLHRYGQGILKVLNPVLLKDSRIQGKNYAIPANKELASQGGIIYRKDIADKLGLTERLEQVRSISDLEPILKIVKRKEPEMTPLFFTQGENFNAHYFANYDYFGDANIPGAILKDGNSTKVVPRFDLKRYRDYLAITRRFMLEGLLNKDAATSTFSTTDALRTGKVFAIPAPLKPGKADEVALAAGIPGKLKQIAMTPRTVSTDETTGSMLAISTTSGDPERAMMFINLLYTDKYLNNLLNFGIEGVHYRKISKNMIAATPNTPNYNPGTEWMFGNQFLNYLWDTEDPDKWEAFKHFNTGAKHSPALGFIFNSEPVKTEAAAAQNIRKQFDPALDTGSVDPKTVLPVYKEKLLSAGLNQIIAEKQKQLDAFLNR